MVTTDDNYFNVLKIRAINASISPTLLLWRELFVIFFLGTIGVWVPFMFDWPGNDILLRPEAVFTFGIATMVVILERRLFLDISEDGKFFTATKFIIFILFIVSFLSYLKGIHATEVNSSSRWINLALSLTFLAWFYNHINNSRYDETSLLSVLGGENE